MLCPFCGHDNTPGADECQACLADLTAVEPAATPASLPLLRSPVRLLSPATPVSVAVQTTVREALELMVSRRIGCVLVYRGEELAGIFTERDVLMKVSGDPAGAAERPVADFMTAKPETVDADDEIAFALHKMDVGGYRHLPVTEAGRVSGIISVRSVLTLLAQQLLDE